MAVVPCFVVVDLAVRKVFLLQEVHRLAEWLGPESAWCDTTRALLLAPLQHDRHQ